MNNLEGWGGPNPESWYIRQEKLQKKIVKRMREYGIEPVLPGYCGMVPHNAKEKLGLNVADPGFWCQLSSSCLFTVRRMNALEEISVFVL